MRVRVYEHLQGDSVLPTSVPCSLNFPRCSLPPANTVSAMANEAATKETAANVAVFCGTLLTMFVESSVTQVLYNVVEIGRFGSPVT